MLPKPLAYLLLGSLLWLCVAASNLFPPTNNGGGGGGAGGSQVWTNDTTQIVRTSTNAAVPLSLVAGLSSVDTNGNFGAQSVTPTNLTASQFVTSDANKKLVSTLDGRPLIYSDTNIISLPFSWAGPSNAAAGDNGYHFYTTTTPFSFTNFPAVSGSNLWSVYVISNQTANSITGWCTIPGIRIYNGLPGQLVPAGKTVIYSFLSISTLMTNAQISTQSN